MEMVQQKIAHLKGLAEGLDLFAGKDGKVYQEIIDIITDIDENIQHIHNRLLDLEEYVDVIDEDLNDIENEYYDESTDEDFDDDYDEDIDEDINFIDNTFSHILCPYCEKTVIVDYSLFDDNESEKILCPSCEKQIIINIDALHEE